MAPICEEGVNDGVGVTFGAQQQQCRHDANGNEDNDAAQNRRDLVDFTLERGGFFLDLVEHEGDSTHLRVRTGGDNNGFGAALGDGGAAVDHARAVCQVSVGGEGGGVLRDGVSLTREGGFDGAQSSGFEQASIRAHLVTFSEDEDVSDNEFTGGNDLADAIAQDRGGCCRHG